jgi:ABC-2 type transport system permease protein
MVKGLRGTVGSTSRVNNQTMYNVTWAPFTPIIWQHYNPIPKDRMIPDAAIFADDSAPGGEDTFNPDVAGVSGLGQVLFLAPGAIEEMPLKDAGSSQFQITPLVRVGTSTGLMHLDQLRNQLQGAAGEDPILLQKVGPDTKAEARTDQMGATLVKGHYHDDRVKTGERYMLAAQITSLASASTQKKDDKSDASPGVNVILVADIDFMDSLFLQLRNQPQGPIQYSFENVTFALNVIDVLAGDERFIEIRKRRTRHATLSLIERQFQDAEQQMDVAIKAFEKKINDQQHEATSKRQTLLADLQQEVDDAQKKFGNGEILVRKVRELQERLTFLGRANEREEEEQKARLRRQLNQEQNRITRELELSRQSIQNNYKMLAVMLPPIPPLLVALMVFAIRRLREREGVSKARLR